MICALVPTDEKFVPSCLRALIFYVSSCPELKQSRALKKYYVPSCPSIFYVPSNLFVQKSDGTNERTGWRWRFSETQHGVWGRYQLGRIKNHGQRERKNTEEDARGSGNDQTEGDEEEGVEYLQPNGTLAIDDILTRF